MISSRGIVKVEFMIGYLIGGELICSLGELVTFGHGDPLKLGVKSHRCNAIR